MPGMTNTHGPIDSVNESKSIDSIPYYEEKMEFAKLRAKILLSDRSSKKIIIPSYDEMCGLYGLERDDQLPKRKDPNR